MIKIIGIISSVLASGFLLSTINNIDTPETPVITNVDISTKNVVSPSINIDYTSRILDKNLLYVTGFEDGDMPYEYKYFNFPSGHNREFGGQTRTSEEKSEGSYSTKIVDTYTNGNYDRGYDVNGEHLGYEPYSVLRYKQRLYLPDNVHVSFTADVKTTEKAIFSSSGIGGKIDKPDRWGGRRFTKDVNIGDTVIYSTKIDQRLKDQVSRGERMYIALKDSDCGDYNFALITDVNVEEGSVTLSDPMEQEFKKDDYILAHMHINPILFKNITIENATDWTSIQSNALVDSSKYTTSKRGIEYWWKTETAGTAYVDNIRFGYANKIKVMKNGKLDYEGYDLSYTNSDNPDREKPNSIESIQGALVNENDGNIVAKIKFNDAIDNGTVYRYSVIASYDNKDSKPTEDIILNSTSGIKGYSYEINELEESIPDDVIDTTKNNISQTIDNHSENLYIHIKSIDNSGNASDTTHYKIEKQETNLTHQYNNDKIDLSWKFTDNNVDQYYFDIYRKENEGDFKLIKSKHRGTTYTDEGIVDNISPNKPTIENINYNKENKSFEYSLNPGDDNGINYSYKIEAFLNNGDKVSTSNIENIEIKSGFKEFLYEIDNNSAKENTLLKNLGTDLISLSTDNVNKYLHIQAIDNNNNFSEIESVKILDDEKPILDLRLTNYSPTNKSISIIASAKDNTEIDYIILPNGTRIKSDNASYTVSKNGTYTFMTVDILGNITIKSIKVSNIDTSKPTIEINKNPNSEWANTDVDIDITGED